MTDGTAAPSPDPFTLEGDDDDINSGEAVYTVQPEEITSYKAVRRVVDREFVSRDNFIMSTSTYFYFFPTINGFNTYLRSLLFPPSCRWQRGHTSEMREQLGTDDRTETVKGSGKKQTQRQSKQKERCENRLLSLFFACVYDPATRDCLLARGIPPLKLRKEDKNGKYRNVSNFTVVRAFLRHIVTSVGAAYGSSVRILTEMAPQSTGLLPVTFMLIARTFVMMLERKVLVSTGTGGVDDDDIDDKKTAELYLVKCLDAVREYLTVWEKRNYTTDNNLTNCLEAVKNDVVYNTSHKLLQSMITLVTPARDGVYDDKFREQVIYKESLPEGVDCTCGAGGECMLLDPCPGNGPKICSPNVLLACHAYLDAFVACVKATDTYDIETLDGVFKNPSFSTVHWKYAVASTDLHRTKNVSNLIKISRKIRNEGISLFESQFVCSTRQEVAHLWAALSRSNVQAKAFMNNLDIPNTDELTSTVVELVFGGGIATRAILERPHQIVPISAKLLSKKGSSVGNNKQNTTPKEHVGDEDGEDEGNNRVEVEQNEEDSHPTREHGEGQDIAAEGHEHAQESSKVTAPSSTTPVPHGNATNDLSPHEYPDDDNSPSLPPSLPSPRRTSPSMKAPPVTTPGVKRRQRKTKTRKSTKLSCAEGEGNKRKRRTTMTQTVQDAEASGNLPNTGTKRRRKIRR